MGCLTIRARGTFSSRALCSNAFTITVTVAMPDSSIALPTCPTDTWQTGQRGTRSMTSVPSSRILSTQPGSSLRNRPCDVAPGKEKKV